MKNTANYPEQLLMLLCLLFSGIFYSAGVSYAQIGLKYGRGQDVTTNNISKGYIYRNPQNKQDIQGYLKIPVVYSSLVSDNSIKKEISENLIKFSVSIQSFIKLKITIDNIVALDSQVLGKYPLVCLSLTDEGISPAEKANLGSCISGDGFIIIECSEENRVKNCFPDNVTLKKVPRDNPVYDCFYDITDEKINFNGIWMGDKLAGIYGIYLSRMGKDLNYPESGRAIAGNVIVYSLLRNNKS